MTCQNRDFDEAVAYAYKVLKRQQRVHGLNSIESVKAFCLIAKVFSEKEDYQEELTNRLKAIEILKEQVFTYTRQIIDEYRTASICLSNMEEYEKAEEFASNALAISLKAYGEKNPNTVHSMETLASVKNYLEKYEEALELYTRALGIYISETGEDSKPTANAYHNLSDAYWSLGNLEEAIRFEKKALEICQKINGPESPACEEFYERLGILNYKSNNFKEALSFISKAYQIVKTNEIPIGQGYYLHELGIIYAGKGDIDNAIKVFQEAISLLPADHPEAIDSKERLQKLEETT